MRERATAHRLVQDGHEEHVAIFEVRFHLIDGLDSGKEMFWVFFLHYRTMCITAFGPDVLLS